MADATAVEELWGTVWHQGTVYECTPVAVPFLVRLATDPSGDDASRSQVALLLASIAGANSFVLPQDPRQMLRPGWLREPGEPTPARDLTVESRAAVGVLSAVIARAVAGAPKATRAGLVALLASVASDLSTDDLNVLVSVADDPLLAAAARLTRALAEGTVNDVEVAAVAALDEEAADYLTSIVNWPVRVRAAELVRELCERVAGATLG